jgi:hypothetical protein
VTETIAGRTKQWLSQQGYPLEFSTAATFESHGFHTQQSVYIAHEEGAYREMDVVASYVDEAEDRTYRVSFIVECKWSRDKPWVVFTRGDTPVEEPLAYTLASTLGEGVAWEMMNDLIYRDLLVYERRRRTGFGGRQAFSGDKDVFYSTLQGLGSAAVAFVRGEESSSPFVDPRAQVHFAFPIVVVDAPLFEAYFKDGEIQLEQVEYARIRWRRIAHRERPVFIEIVTAEAVSNYVGRLAVNMGALTSRMRRLGTAVSEAAIHKRWGEMKALPENFRHVMLPWYLKQAGFDRRERAG